MWFTIYATFWALWTHKPIIKLAKSCENCCQGMCININNVHNWARHGNLHYEGLMQPTNGGGNGICETSVQKFARHQVVGIATNGGML
jgi:hypothetical protein